MSADLYEYECSKGHWQSALKELKKCQVYVHGHPCDGKLKRVGQGSRKANAA